MTVKHGGLVEGAGARHAGIMKGWWELSLRSEDSGLGWKCQWPGGLGFSFVQTLPSAPLKWRLPLICFICTCFLEEIFRTKCFI